MGKRINKMMMPPALRLCLLWGVQTTLLYYIALGRLNMCVSIYLVHVYCMMQVFLEDRTENILLGFGFWHCLLSEVGFQWVVLLCNEGMTFRLISYATSCST